MVAGLGALRQFYCWVPLHASGAVSLIPGNLRIGGDPLPGRADCLSGAPGGAYVCTFMSTFSSLLEALM